MQMSVCKQRAYRQWEIKGCEVRAVNSIVCFVLNFSSRRLNVSGTVHGFASKMASQSARAPSTTPITHRLCRRGRSTSATKECISTIWTARSLSRVSTTTTCWSSFRSSTLTGSARRTFSDSPFPTKHDWCPTAAKRRPTMSPLATRLSWRLLPMATSVARASMATFLAMIQKVSFHS